jgi:hypothetical protein
MAGLGLALHEKPGMLEVVGGYPARGRAERAKINAGSYQTVR